MSATPPRLHAVLPRGLNKLPREVVADSQRSRIKQAMAHSVAAKGYAATTVADLTGLAGVSRTTFYEHFADKEACYLACFDDQIRYLIKRMAQGGAAKGPPPARLAGALQAFVEVVAAEPVYSLAYMGLASTAGPRVLDELVAHNDQVIGLLQAIDAQARSPDQPHLRVPRALFDIAMHGMYDYMCAEIRAGRCTALPQHLPQFCYLWFSVLGHPRWARQALECAPEALPQLRWSARGA